MLQANVGAHVPQGKISKDEGAVGGDSQATGLFRTSVHLPLDHLLGETHLTAPEEGPGDGGAVGGGNGAQQEGFIPNFAVHKHSVVVASHTWNMQTLIY